MRASIALLTALLAAPAPALAGCVSAWSSKEYKSIGEVQGEVRARHGGARIIHVKLCGSGADAIIRVVIDTGRDIKTISLPAKR
ncbi:MAG: hypothetical protein NW215_06530 [Hyphomicrobiales bacterium]|nr:hypothetical protein [Hyphomicrobiales bacterium]